MVLAAGLGQRGLDALRFGVVDANSIRRGTKKVPSKVITSYLSGLGFPRRWAGADQAIDQLTAHGVPVSPAAQEMIRRFGGLDTHMNAPPPAPAAADIRHAPGRFYIDPADVAGEAETAREMESDMGLSALCPIGWELNGGGLMCIDAEGTLWFQDSAHGYAGDTPDEVLALLLEGRPNRRW